MSRFLCPEGMQFHNKGTGTVSLGEVRPDLVGITLTGQLVCPVEVSVKDGVSPGGPLSLG